MIRILVIAVFLLISYEKIVIIIEGCIINEKLSGMEIFSYPVVVIIKILFYLI